MSGLIDKINDAKKNFLDNVALRQLDKKKIIGIFFIAVVLVYLEVAFLMSLQLKAVKKADSDFKKLSAEKTRFEKEFSQSEKAQGGTQMTKEIIAEAEIPLLLQDITDMANKNNVRILQLNPVKAVKAKKGSPATELNSNLIALDLICDYHSLGAFINELENAPKFMAVEELRINPDADSIFQQSVNLVIKIYVKK
jgi:Tfp pilus assembly protein PilO